MESLDSLCPLINKCLWVLYALLYFIIKSIIIVIICVQVYEPQGNEGGKESNNYDAHESLCTCICR